MKPQTLQSVISDYERLTGEQFEMRPDLYMKVIDNNFMLWKLDIREGVPFFWIDQTYAKSFSVFVPFIQEVCNRAKVEYIATATTRNPRGHIRKWKGQRLPQYDYEYEGRQYKVLISHVDNLK